MIKISRRTNFDQIEYHLSTTSTSISLNSFFFFFGNDTGEIYYLLAYLIPAFFFWGWWGIINYKISNKSIIKLVLI